MSPVVVHDLEDLKPAERVITIGNFDGVHLGHQHLLDAVRQSSKQLQARGLVVTFDPLPLEVLRPEHAPRRLLSKYDRVERIGQQGIDDVAVLEFSREFAAQSAEEFVERLVATAQPVRIVVGEDFAFGRNRGGTPDELKRLGAHHGFDVQIIQRIGTGPLANVSSSEIRRFLSDEGDIKTAEQLLGQPFLMRGTVVHGEKRGRELGFPTANVLPGEPLVIPQDGIYAAFAGIDREEPTRPSMVYIGDRPTFGNSDRIIEVHLLDFNGDLYDRHLSVKFFERIRGDVAFESVPKLIEQMEQDERETRAIFATAGCADKPS